MSSRKAFEEIFMLQEQSFWNDAAAEMGELTARRLPERIIRQLRKEGPLPFSDKPPEVKVLIAMREDELGVLQELTPQIPGILQNRFRLTGLSADDARKAIVKAATMISEEIQFAARPFKYEEEAIEEMIAAAPTKEGGIDPFFLQILCSNVEKQVQQRQAGEVASDSLIEVDSGYLASEQGIKTFVTGFYIDAVNRISDPKVRERVRKLCEEGLLTASGNRRSLLKEDIESNFGVESRYLDVLENIRLLRKESKDRSFNYEISHDRVAAAIYEKRVPRDRRAREETERIMDDLTRRAGEETQRIMEDLMFQLRDRLKPRGRLLDPGRLLDLLGEVQTDVEAYYERMAEADESVEMQHRRANANETKGDIVFTRGDLEGALKSYRKRHDIAERLAASDPSNAQWQRDLSVGYEKIGDVQRARRDLPTTLSSYKRSLEIVESLAASDPANTQWQRDLSVIYEKIGGVQMAQGDLPKTLGSYKRSLEIAERLAASDPANTQWQRDLSVIYEKIGDLQRTRRDLHNALSSYKKSLEIREKLAAHDPANAQWQRGRNYAACKAPLVGLI
jgi:tetratricopeptide (TPR) repeat protein